MSSWLRALERHASVVGGVLMLLAAGAALAVANSPAADAFARFWQVPVTLGIGETLALTEPIEAWVNEGLLTLLFLLVGLELKRELARGSLSDLRSAAFPVSAALGGVIVPAAIYAAINSTEGGARAGWAIPSATDIAFAFGIVALFGKRLPVAVRLLLATVAVVDDIIAVVIIGAFYTSEVAFGPLLVALALWGTGALIAKSGVQRSWVYALVGIGIWIAMFESGLHATLAGVLTASIVPLRSVPAAPVARATTHSSVLERWEHALQPIVGFGVVPIFALANAGIVWPGMEELLTSPVAIGVALGLLVGKPAGFLLFSWISVRSGATKLPRDVEWRHLFGIAWLAGIGFTMSLMISQLALADEALTTAVSGLLLASAAAAAIGAFAIWVAVARVDAWRVSRVGGAHTDMLGELEPGE